MKRSQILDESPKVQNFKNATNREQPGQNEATKLEAPYKIYPDMKPAEDNSTRPQPSKKKINKIIIIIIEINDDRKGVSSSTKNNVYSKQKSTVTTEIYPRSPTRKNKVNSQGQTDYNAKKEKQKIWNSVGKEIR